MMSDDLFNYIDTRCRMDRLTTFFMSVIQFINRFAPLLLIPYIHPTVADFFKFNFFPTYRCPRF